LAAQDTSESYSLSVGERLYDLRFVTTGTAPTWWVPRRAEISSITLNGVPVEDYETRTTNRGKEVIVEAPTSGEQTLVVETAP
jgi:hypothetical protein